MTTLGILGRLRQSLWTHPLATRRTDWRIVADVQARALRMRTLTDAGLHGAADQLRTQVQGGASLRQPEIVSQAFACLYESLRREQGIELYEVQILAGLALSGGAIAEMQTGEGKTLAAALPAFLFSLTGAGVHVATPNHYLASRDCELLAPVFLRLGTRAALLPEEHAPDAKRAAYAADVTYGTGYEFGFDYLRDQLLRLADRNQPLGHRFRQVLQGDLSTATQFVQRGLALAIIDEVDSVLIDEACMPLVIAAAGAGRADDPAPYQTAAHVARQLIAGQDFTLDAVERRIALTNAGSARIHLALPRSVGSLRRAWSEYVRQALHAQHLLQRDVDYVVADDRAVIVDEFTGRVYAERSWRDGLHQAVAAKEGLPIDEETAVAARISRQRYFRQYAQICGMTGTARGAEREFWRLFQLPIVEIPLHRPSQRRLLPTRAFATTDAKLAAIVAEVLKLHRQGRPVLVGTRTIDSSEQIARRLSKTGVVFRLLNGKQDADEAAVIAQAG